MIQDGVMFVCFLLAFTAVIAGCGKKDWRKVLQVCSWYCPYLYWSGSDENIRGLFR